MLSGALFDPFDFLQRVVARLQRAWEDHKHVQRSLNDLRDGVESLKKEEARLKARIRTAKAKVAPVGSPALSQSTPAWLTSSATQPCGR